MERDNIQLVDDNCSQIEVAFKRMKVGTSRCTGKKSHHHIYNQSKHYHHHHQSHKQLQPQQQQSNHLHHHQQQQQQDQSSQLANQIAQHPDPNQPLTNPIISPNTTRVNSYYNQIFNTNTRVIPESFDDDTVDRLSSKDKSEALSFSSFSASPLALLNNFPFSKTVSSSSSLSSSASASSASSSSSSSSSTSISPSSAVTPPSTTTSSSSACNFVGPYRDFLTREGQTDSFDHKHQPNHNNQNNNNNKYHLNQSNDNTKYEDGPPADPDVSVEELAAYLDVQLYIPRKMSYMAELMYT